MTRWTPDPTFYPSPRLAAKAPAETLAYVAAFAPKRDVPDSIAVVDLDPASPTYSKIVGGIDIDPAKIGRDIGQVVGLSRRVGAKVSSEAAKAIRAAKPDVVVLCTSSSAKTVLPQVEAILKTRTPIVSTTEELSYPWCTNVRQASQIDAWAKKAKVAVLSTGVNPGFVMDALPIALMAACQRVDRVTVRYASPFALMHDLRRMGAGNPLVERRRTPLRRATLMRMAQIYAERFADPDERIRATFDIVWLSGWAPHESQQKPLRPGSAKARLADALGTIEISAGEKARPK